MQVASCLHFCHLRLPRLYMLSYRRRKDDALCVHIDSNDGCKHCIFLSFGSPCLQDWNRWHWNLNNPFSRHCDVHSFFLLFFWIFFNKAKIRTASEKVLAAFCNGRSTDIFNPHCSLRNWPILITWLSFCLVHSFLFILSVIWIFLNIQKNFWFLIIELLSAWLLAFNVKYPLKAVMKTCNDTISNEYEVIL